MFGNSENIRKNMVFFKEKPVYVHETEYIHWRCICILNKIRTLKIQFFSLKSGKQT